MHKKHRPGPEDAFVPETPITELYQLSTNRMADEDLSLNEDQLLDSLDDANGDAELMQDVRTIRIENPLNYS